MRYSFLLLLTAFVFIIFTSTDCHRDVAFPKGQYAFKEQMSITPYRLNYSIGDTIWIDYAVPDKKLFDTITQSRILYDSAAFNVNITAQLLYNNPFITTGPFATFVYPLGISASDVNGGGRTVSYVQFGCANLQNGYQLKIGVVLTHKGLVGISVGPYSSYSGGYYLSKCFTNISDYSLLRFVFNVADAHKDVYLQQMFGAIGKTPDAQILAQLDRKEMVVINVQ
jgi:hypothetical protein